jgi:hypothetical protein
MPLRCTCLSRAGSLAPLALTLVLFLDSTPAAGPEDAEPAGGIRLELAASTTHVGDELEVRLEAHTGAPLRVFAIRVEAVPSLIRLRSWSFGEGIARHIALYGEPPACDIIVYPDGSRMLAVMVMDPPFSSDEYGTGCLSLRFAVEAESPVTTCILYSGDTPDYEPGDDLLSVIRRMRPERQCAIVRILPSLRFRRGDVDADGRQDLADAVGVLRFLFLGGTELECADAADFNDDGTVNVSDAVLLLRALFQGAPPLSRSCGLDSTDDRLAGCARSSC